MPESITSARLLDLFALMHALIDAGWTKRAYAINSAGEARRADAPDTVQYCLVGAGAAAAFALGLREPPIRLSRLEEPALALLNAVRPRGSPDLCAYNDAPTRRKRDILRLIERAAARVGK